MEEEIPRGMSFDQARLVGLERQNRELRDQMEELTRAVQQLMNNQPQHQQAPRGRIDHDLDNDIHDPGIDDDREEQQRFRRQPRNYDNIKMKIPPFRGTSSPDEYLEWVQRVEKVFECQDYTEIKKVRLAALEFTDYANLWWENMKAQRRREGEEYVSSWRHMKRLMEKRFVPEYYKQELYLKLQTLRQGGMCVEDYVKEFEMLMMRCDLQEPQEQTIARFLSGLHKEIADIVELQPYVFLDDVIKLAVRVERQCKRGVTRFTKTSNTSTTSSNFNSRTAAKQVEKSAPSKTTPITPQGKEKEGDTTTISRSRDIKCFKCLGRGHIASECPTKKVMIIHEANDEIESEDEVVAEEEEGEVMYAEEGELLVIRRNLTLQTKVDEEQRENLFHTRCNVRGKVCSLIIDGGSCTNVAAISLVEKLNLATVKHPKPYHLQWLDTKGDLKVTEQVVVPFSIGGYKDEVTFDVIPMTASHLLLGRPWQFDRKANHDGYLNTYSLTKDGKRVVLAPLSP